MSVAPLVAGMSLRSAPITLVISNDPLPGPREAPGDDPW
jgi:hypothetical protein